MQPTSLAVLFWNLAIAMASNAVRAAIQMDLTHLTAQLARHGWHLPLYQDVVRSLAAWAVPSTRQMLSVGMPSCGLETVAAGLQQLHLTGAELDSALSTLRLLSTRVTALSSMAHDPSSCSANRHGVKVEAKSWLLPQRSTCQQHCQFAYEVHIVNRSSEAMQLLGKTWDVQELSGACRSRSSPGLMGLKPVIDSEETATFQTGITLSSIKGSMEGSFLFQGVKSRSKYVVPVTPFALTPTAEQYMDPRYMPTGARLYPRLGTTTTSSAGGVDHVNKFKSNHCCNATICGIPHSTWDVLG